MATTYGNDTEITSDRTEDTATKLKTMASDTASQAKDKVQEVGRNVRSKIDESRAPAAEKLQSAASALHDKAGALPGGQAVTDFAHSAADRMQATAAYVRQHDVNAMWSDVEACVRKYPGQSLAAAAALGFLLGRRLSSED
jgi:ElaB/YqjD/DUF883 family membrane-anchored ribosome-binding protein